MSATLKSRLPAIAAELRPKVSGAVKEIAEAVAHGAALRAPVESGALKRAIHVERRGGAEYAVVAGNQNVYYGHLVEHGTSHSAPQPFLVPALETERLHAAVRVQRALRSL